MYEDKEGQWCTLREEMERVDVYVKAWKKKAPCRFTNKGTNTAFSWGCLPQHGIGSEKNRSKHVYMYVWTWDTWTWSYTHKVNKHSHLRQIVMPMSPSHWPVPGGVGPSPPLLGPFILAALIDQSPRCTSLLPTSSSWAFGLWEVSQTGGWPTAQLQFAVKTPWHPKGRKREIMNTNGIF